MPEGADLQTFALGGIAHRCTEETALFFAHRPHDPRYCYELFRRAILLRNQRAWELIYAEYQPLAAGWINRHSGFPASGEETQYFVNRAFEKMWQAVTPDRFNQFPDLQSLLRYLQMCAHSAIMDRLRAADQAELEADLGGVTLDAGGEAQAGVEDQALAGMEQGELWRQVGALLHDGKERRLVYGAFVLGLKPREIRDRWPRSFRDVDEVYLVKQNVLARLRRSDEMRKFLGGDD